MTKVLLINPPQKYFSGSENFSLYFPLGLLCIAAKIKDVCSVQILDFLARDFETKTTLEFTIYGSPIAKIEAELKKYSPDIIGITAPFTAQAEQVIGMSKLCREIHKQATIIIGGPDASVRYEMFLTRNHCDFCVVGEGEQTLYEFIKNFEQKDVLKNTAGLAYKENGLIRYKKRAFIGNLDMLPPPAYELIDFKDYLNNALLYAGRSRVHKNSISVITSRGCPYACVFCAIKLHMGQRFRAQSPDYVIDHLEFIIKKYGISNFHFEDDNISFDQVRFEKILDKIIQHKLNIQWDTPNGIRTDSLNYDLLNKIKRSGCQELTISIESGNQKVLDEIIKKSTKLDRMLEVIQICQKLKIRLGAFYVIGFPGETKENMNQTISLALNLFKTANVIPHLLIATPLPGTKLYEQCLNLGLITEDFIGKDFSIATKTHGTPLFSTDDFSKEDIKKLVTTYQQGLKKASLIYSLKNFRYALKRILNNPKLLKRILFFRQSGIS